MATFGTYWDRVKKSPVGKATWITAKESVGFSYSSMFGTNVTPEGFLGIRHSLEEMTQKGDVVAKEIQGGQFGRRYTTAKKLGYSNLRSAGISTRSLVSRNGLKFGAGIAGRTLLRAASPAFFAYSIYSGYQEEGITGAAKGGIESIAIGTGLRLAGGAVFNPATIGVVGIATLGYGGYRLGSSGRAHASSLRQLEMGRNAPGFAALNSAAAATARQRAVMALQNSHSNGRMILGREAQILHIPYV